MLTEQEFESKRSEVLKAANWHCKCSTCTSGRFEPREADTIGRSRSSRHLIALSSKCKYRMTGGRE